MDDAEVARVRAYHTANNGVVACVGCNVMVFLQGNDKCECNKPLNYLQIVAENPAKLAKYIADMKSAELTPDYAEYIKHLNKNEGQSDADAHDLIDDLKANMGKLHTANIPAVMGKLKAAIGKNTLKTYAEFLQANTAELHKKGFKV